MSADNLMRLRELRDNLEWFEQYACTGRKPRWGNYRENVKSTTKLVASEIERLVRS